MTTGSRAAVPAQTRGLLADLAVTPVSETIRWLAAGRHSGDLQVRSGKAVRMVFFDSGRIVFAASNVKKERLGETLVTLGRISEDEFRNASALMKADRKLRFGEALVQAGIMHQPDVGRALAGWVERIVLSLFALEAGVALFDERPCQIPLEFMVGLSVHRILYEGIRSIPNRDLAFAALGDLERSVRLADVAPFSFDIKTCSKEEVEILKRARQQSSLRSLASTGDGVGFTRLRVVYALLAGGILEPAAGSEASPRAQTETNSFLLSDVQRKIRAKAQEATRLEVDAELALSARLDGETWLKLPPTAPRDEVTRALNLKLERCRALREKAGSNEELKTDIEIVEGRARALLQQLAKAAPAAGPRPVPAVPVAPVAPVAPAIDPVSTQAAKPSDAAKAAAEGMQLEHLMMEASVRMSVGDFASAVQSYGRLVDLQPEVALHRLRLAAAMSRWPQTARQAEREFLEAARLDPDNPDIQFQIGLYYKGMKVRSRAVAAFRTVVRLNPRHSAARAELEAVSPQDSALTSLKKLLK